ncbi:MAG: shikimate dehydrogenase [Pseudomonadota bacterium]
MKQPSGKTKYLPLLAHPVDHVKAPSFVNPAFEKLGLDVFLYPMHVRPENLEPVVRALTKIDNIIGVNLTIPHKEAMAKLCDELGPNGALTGTVNIVRFDNGRLVGEMYDGVGLLIGQREHGIEIAGRSALISGAGGAGRAVAFAYGREGVTRLGIANRSAERAEKLCADMKAALPELDVFPCDADAEGWDVICNCTSLGLHEGDPLPIAVDGLKASTDIVDIIAVRDTELMQAGAAKGCRVMGGVPMAVGQVSAFGRFLHNEPVQ